MIPEHILRLGCLSWLRYANGYQDMCEMTEVRHDWTDCRDAVDKTRDNTRNAEAEDASDASVHV
jgi:hypothetical protein